MSSKKSAKKNLFNNPSDLKQAIKIHDLNQDSDEEKSKMNRLALG